MSSFIPKYMLKRIFPSDAISNVDYNKDKIADHWQLYAINVMMPIAVSDLHAYHIKLEEIAEVFMDNEKLDPKKFIAFYEGQKYTIEEFYSAVDLIIPVGGRAKILYPFSGGLEKGKHKMKANYSWEQFEGTIEYELDLKEDRLNGPFSPNFE